MTPTPCSPSAATSPTPLPTTPAASSRRSRISPRTAPKTRWTPDRAYPRHASRHPGDPRRQARRHRQHRAALRQRSVRPLRRRCGHRQSLPRPRFAAAVPRSRRQGRRDPVPHLESGRARFAGSRSSAASRCTSTSRQTVAREWNANGNCALVVGATFREELAKCARWSATCRCWSPASARRAAMSRPSCATAEPRRHGPVISSSRAILYASARRRLRRSGAHARRKALRDEINRYR